MPLGTSHADYPLAVSTALTKLRDEGIEGPFAVVLNEQLYKDLASRTDEGYPILSHVQRLVDGDIIWAPGLDGAMFKARGLPRGGPVRQRFERHLRAWPLQRLSAALQVILEAEIQCKTTGLPDEAIARRLCQRLAQAGPGARQRRAG